MQNKDKKISSCIQTEEKISSRRAFMKKAAYSAPVLMTLGQLVKPEKASADSRVSGPPDDGWNPW